MSLNIRTLQPGDVGRRVAYRPLHDQRHAEEGFITAWNGSFVFVRYGSDEGSRATHPLNLEWLDESDT